MNSAEWNQLEDLFHQAADLAPPERQQLLESQPSALRAQLERLLNTKGDEDRLRLTVQGAASLVQLPVERIGAYRLVRELGVGGMGSVYLAIRADDAYEKNVAIKFVRRGMDSPYLRARFETERRILARLDHPYIARLLDAGTTQLGQPYFVMEYVEGQRITEYVQSHSLTPRDILALFVKVCQAIQYAHQNLVIHRDIKPSNIQIANDGTPKLLDFGIAKLLDTTEETGTLAQLMTPDYASPEQITGGVINTGTDVYSLGAVLYQLLTGLPPYRISSTMTPAAIEREICLSELKRPSSVDGPNAKQLRGDLDTVIMKAMRRDAKDRYQSASALAEDIESYLEGRSIAARNHTPWDVAMKFARRNATACIAAAVALLSITAGSALAVRYAIQAGESRAVAVTERARADQQRIQAEEHRRLAEASALEARHQSDLATMRANEAAAQRAIADARYQDTRQLLTEFARGVYGKIYSLPGSSRARQSLLQTTVSHLEKLAQSAPDDFETQLTLARVYQQLGDLYASPTDSNAGDRKIGLEYLEKSQKLFSFLATKNSSRVDAQIALLVIGERIAVTKCYYSVWSYEQALAGYESLIQQARRLTARWPDNTELRYHLASTLNSHTLQILRRWPDHVIPDSAREAQQILETLLANPGLQSANNPELRELIEKDYSDSLSAQAQKFVYRREYAQALPLYLKARTFREQLVQQRPTDRSLLRLLMISNSHVGDFYRRMGQPDNPDRAVSFEKMADIAEQLAAADPASNSAQFDLAMGLSRLAEFQSNTHRLELAVANHSKSVSILKRLRLAERDNAVFRSEYLATLFYYGDALLHSKRNQEAIQSYQTMIEEAGDARPMRRRVTKAKARISLAMARMDQPQAIANAEAALAMTRQYHSDTNTAQSAVDLAEVQATVAEVYATSFLRQNNPVHRATAVELFESFFTARAKLDGGLFIADPVLESNWRELHAKLRQPAQ